MRCDGFEVFFVSWCDMWKTGLVWSGQLAKSKLEFSQRLTRAAWFGLGWCTSVCTQSLLYLLQTAIECSNRPDVCTLELYIAQQLIQRVMRSGGLSISLWQTYYSLSLNALLTQWTRFVTPLIGRGWLEMGVLRNMRYENGGAELLLKSGECCPGQKTTGSGEFFTLFRPFFFAFSPFPRTYKTNFAKKSGLACIFWPRWRLKVFASTQGGLPPPTQLTNTNIKIMKIRVSWVGQSTRVNPTKEKALLSEWFTTTHVNIIKKNTMAEFVEISLRERFAFLFRNFDLSGGKL